ELAIAGPYTSKHRRSARWYDDPTRERRTPRQEWHDERHGRLVSSGFPPGSGRGTFSRARSARRVLFDRSEHNAGVPRVAFYRCAGDQTGWLSLLPAARVSLRGLLPSAFM